MKNLITPETRVVEALRIRPLATEFLAKKGLDFWSDAHRTLSDLFRGRPEELEEWLEELGHLPVPAADSLWNELPVAYLLDYLTQDHRELFLNFIPDVEYLLDVQSLSDPGEGQEIRLLQRDFRRFADEMRELVEFEESQIYLRILRYEACLRDARVNPEFQRGSLQIAVANRMSRFSVRRQRLIPEFLERVLRVQDLHPDHPGLPHLAQRLEELQAGLQAHEEHEFETLYPMALEMERTLYNLSIEGAHAASHRVRGPMDSGIMRLGHR